MDLADERELNGSPSMNKEYYYYYYYYIVQYILPLPNVNQHTGPWSLGWQSLPSLQVITETIEKIRNNKTFLLELLFVIEKGRNI